jgi:hypothetical protein
MIATRLTHPPAFSQYNSQPNHHGNRKMKGTTALLLAAAAAAFPAPVAAKSCEKCIAPVEAKIDALAKIVTKLQSQVAELQAAGPAKPAILEVSIAANGGAFVSAYEGVDSRKDPAKNLCGELGYSSVSLTDFVVTSGFNTGKEKGYVTKFICRDPIRSQPR